MRGSHVIGLRNHGNSRRTASIRRATSATSALDGSRFVVHQHVEQRELQLARHPKPALKVLRRDHLVEQRARQRRAGVDVRGQQLQHLPFPREVLHELAGQLLPHPTPRHGYRPNADFIDPGEQMMQSVTKLMEQREDFVECEESRFATDRAAEVAGQE